MIRRIVDALDQRLRAAPFLRSALRKAFPDHWSFMLGEIALYCFVVLVATGVYLALLFSPSSNTVIYRGPYGALDGDPMSAAFASVLRISFETPAGLVIRQIHHWAALVFLAAIGLHVSRIFFTGAFRKPRDINWLVGAALLTLAILAGFTGYSLPDDLLSGTGLRIAYSVAESVPLVGAPAAFLIFGGAYPAAEVTQRLFTTHILILPAAIAGAIGVHLGVVWRQKHTQFPGPGRTEDNVRGSPLWPNYALKSVGLLFFVAAVLCGLGGLVQINPVWAYGPYDAAVVSSPAQPDWYVGWLEGALRIAPAWDLHLFGRAVPPVFWPGVVLPAIMFGVLFCWPFIERRLTRDRAEHHLLDQPSQVPWRTATGVAALTFAGILTLAGSDDVQATSLAMPVESLVAIYRVSIVLLPVVAWFLAFQLAREIGARRRANPSPPYRMQLERDGSGGFGEREAPVESARR